MIKDMKQSIYQLCKSDLKEFADCEQTEDKPMRRMNLNDYLDFLSKSIGVHSLKGKISYKQANLYMNWLTNYTIKRHEK